MKGKGIGKKKGVSRGEPFVIAFAMLKRGKGKSGLGHGRQGIGGEKKKKGKLLERLFRGEEKSKRGPHRYYFLVRVKKKETAAG